MMMRNVVLIASGVVLFGACPQPNANPDAGAPADGAIIHVNKAGNGTGTLFTNPAGVDCGTDCTDQVFAFDPDIATVTLVSEPARDALFESLTCTGTKDGVALDDLDADGPELVLFDDAAPTGIDITCTGSFRKVTTLEVFFSGQGSGRVVGALLDAVGGGGAPRVDCPTDCTGAYFVEEVDTLTAIAEPGSAFAGWRLCGDGTADVTLAMDVDRNCEAQFDLE